MTPYWPSILELQETKNKPTILDERVKPKVSGENLKGQPTTTKKVVVSNNREVPTLMAWYVQK